MIEILHYKNRFGKRCVTVFVEDTDFWWPEAEEYYSGKDEPEFQLPCKIIEVIRFVDVIYICERHVTYEVHDERYYTVLQVHHG